jgi:MFS family permease
LFGFIFLITQYFQLVHGYSPLSAGVHTLPFALGVGAAAPVAPILARRLGTKIIVPAGLLLMAAGFFIASTVGSDTAFFGPVIISMLLMAIGLGLTTAPSTDAILAVLAPGKAGVGSAVNDVTRELGGTFGVAVVGAVFASVYGPQLTPLLHGLGLPAPALAAARQSPAAALQIAAHAPPSAHTTIINAAHQAFVHGLSRGSIVCATAVALGAVFAFLVLPRRLPNPHQQPAATITPDRSHENPPLKRPSKHPLTATGSPPGRYQVPTPRFRPANDTLKRPIRFPLRRTEQPSWIRAAFRKGSSSISAPYP